MSPGDGEGKATICKKRIADDEHASSIRHGTNGRSRVGCRHSRRDRRNSAHDSGGHHVQHAIAALRRLRGGRARH